MFNFLALISVLVSTALAQSPAANNTNSANPLIPTGISDSCNIFLNALNSDATLASCLAPLMNITSAFAPGNANPSSSVTKSALTNLCSSSTTDACSPSSIRQNLTQFYVACTVELTTNPITEVRTIYEVLYTFLPLQTAVCSTDGSGNFCVTETPLATREFNEDSYGAVTRRDQASIMPNLTDIAARSIPFVFITPDLNATELCVPCTRQIITAYINFESNLQFSFGLNNSVLLGGQSSLYSAVQSKCPSSFLSGTVAAAGGLSSSAISTYDAEYQRIITLVMGAVTLVALAL